jgi:hypothetical protein
MAQRLSPEVLSVGGGIAKSASLSLEWTLGESVVETHYATDRLYTQGFHQPTLYVTEQVADLTGTDGKLQFIVAPNPVTSHLTVTVSSAQETPLQLWLTDMAGHQYPLPNLPATVESTQVDMTRFPAGTYLLHISRDTGARLKSYKVLKTQ